MPLTSMSRTEAGYTAFAAFAPYLLLPSLRPADRREVRNTICVDLSVKARHTDILICIRNFFGLNEG